MSYGQSPSPEFLGEVLEGSLVAIVAIEEGSLAEAFKLHDYSQQQQTIGGSETSHPSDIDVSTPEDLISRTTTEDLPYIHPNTHGFCPPLNPAYSQCLGLALIRSIDASTKQLQVLTPLSETEIAALMSKKVVLVRGSFDSPGWAYLEDLYSADNNTDERSYAAVTTNDRPWVSEKGDMVGIEGAVWRLRHPPMAAAATR